MSDPDLFRTEQVVLQGGPYDGQEWGVRVREYELRIPRAAVPDDPAVAWPEPCEVYRRVPDAPRFRFVQ